MSILALFALVLIFGNLPASASPWFPDAIDTVTNINFNGNNARIDSFNSTNPAYSDWNTNLGYGTYVSYKARAHGNVATDSTATNAISIGPVGQANIYGTVNTGPGGSILIGNNGYVGPLPQTGIGIQPGYTNDTMTNTFPDVVLPTGAGQWQTLSGNLIASSGNYYLSSLNGSLDIEASNVQIYVAGNINISGNASITIGTNVTNASLYVAGPVANFFGNGLINNSQRASTLAIYGLPTLTSLVLVEPAANYETIYAPEADCQLGGGGNNTVDFVGAMTVRSLKLNGHANFHYDESLGTPTAYTTLWFEQQPQDTAAVAGYYAGFRSWNGGLAMNIQWYFNNTNPLAGATNYGLTLTNVQPSDAGTYSLVVTNYSGSLTSTPASLTVYTNVSVPLTPPQLNTNGGVSFAAICPPGVPLVAQVSTNLADWIPFGPATNAAPYTNLWYRYTFNDPQASNSPQRYYRIVVGPP